MSQTKVVFFSFLAGLAIDMFSNTPGMHAAACTLAGFLREPLIRFYMGKDLPEGIYPSYKTFGYGGFFRYAVTFIIIQHVALFLLESLTFFDPVFLALRIFASVAMTTLLVCTVEAFNIESQKSGE
ncbi:rod shape-determining protein MreD [Parabacteroides chinchillae]|uniref:Rod shape-determining protein MreD n=2 Tax=Tannerellaceae TaxID=2005525 RepID=A0A8G2BXZ0_9BACT|nr:rod shape-determining protein MreD [Parabacteroides chinchillae]